MTVGSSFSERLMELIVTLGLNKNSFAMKIGLSDNATIVRIVNDPTRGASFPVLQAIMTAFPEVNPRWLILGEGEMFEKEEWRKRQLYTKYFKLASSDLLFIHNEKEAPEPTDMMRVYGFYDCDVAADVIGDSMEPRFNNGDMLLCKTVTPEMKISFGEAYVILTKGDAMVRYIRGMINDAYRLSAESQRIDDTAVTKVEIRAIFKVRGVIRRVAL